MSFNKNFKNFCSEVIQETIDRKLSASNISDITDEPTETSDEFLMEFTGDSMFLFLDDDEEPQSISLGDETDGESRDILSHILDKSPKCQRFSEDMDLYSIRKF